MTPTNDLIAAAIPPVKRALPGIWKEDVLPLIREELKSQEVKKQVWMAAGVVAAAWLVSAWWIRREIHRSRGR